MTFALMLAFAVAPVPAPVEAKWGPTLPGCVEVPPAWPLNGEAGGFRCAGQHRERLRVEVVVYGWGLGLASGYGSLRQPAHYYLLPVDAGRNLPLCGDDPDFLLYPPAHQAGLRNVDDTASRCWTEIEEECHECEREILQVLRANPDSYGDCLPLPLGSTDPVERSNRLISSIQYCNFPASGPASPIELLRLSHPGYGVFWDVLAPGNALASLLHDSPYLGEGNRTVPNVVTFVCWDMTGYADLRPLRDQIKPTFDLTTAVVNDDAVSETFRAYGMRLNLVPHYFWHRGEYISINF